MIYDVAVVGAGASGMAAAIAAKRKNPDISVALVEALPKVGKKILATGNGRCNLTNLNANTHSYNSGFCAPVMKKFPPHEIIGFFASIGLACVSDGEGRVYPMSNTAASVLDCLKNELERLKIDVLCDVHVDAISKTAASFRLDNGLECRRLVLACGGKAAPSQGSDGSGYALLANLGHGITPTYPGLVQLETRENLKPLKGCRVKANVKLLKGGSKLDESSGEVLFTDYGLSGIAVMDVSRSVKIGGCVCELDMLPSLSFGAAVDFLMNLKKHNPDLTLSEAMAGMLPFKVGQAVLKAAGAGLERQLAAANIQLVKSIIGRAKGMQYTVTAAHGFNNAQITVGGAQLGEFDPNTLQSKKVRGLYCTGELLDVDAACGGYNLQWAWASGITAGESAAQL